MQILIMHWIPPDEDKRMEKEEAESAEIEAKISETTGSNRSLKGKDKR
jgi:hypothetical protein